MMNTRMQAKIDSVEVGKTYYTIKVNLLLQPLETMSFKVLFKTDNKVYVEIGDTHKIDEISNSYRLLFAQEENNPEEILKNIAEERTRHFERCCKVVSRYDKIWHKPNKWWFKTLNDSSLYPGTIYDSNRNVRARREFIFEYCKDNNIKNLWLG